MNEILSLLNYMQSLGDVITSLEFNQSSTHTLWTKGSLSLELIYLVTLHDWDCDMKVEESLQI